MSGSQQRVWRAYGGTESIGEGSIASGNGAGWEAVSEALRCPSHEPFGDRDRPQNGAATARPCHPAARQRQRSAGQSETPSPDDRAPCRARLWRCRLHVLDGHDRRRLDQKTCSEGACTASNVTYPEARFDQETWSRNGDGEQSAALGEQARKASAVIAEPHTST